MGDQVCLKHLDEAKRRWNKISTGSPSVIPQEFKGEYGKCEYCIEERVLDGMREEEAEQEASSAIYRVTFAGYDPIKGKLN